MAVKAVKLTFEMKSNNGIPMDMSNRRKKKPLKRRVPVLTWESYKGNARTRDAYRTVCFITRRTC